MALTRAMLKAMDIDSDKADQIFAAHTDVVESIKAERDELRGKAAEVPDLKKQIEELEAAKPTEDWEAKYNELKAEHESFKTQVAEEKAKAEKASLYRAVLREAGVEEKYIDDIMGVTDFAQVVVENGAIADAEGVRAKVAEKYASFIPQVSTKGADPATPPEQQQTENGANPDVMKRLQERHERIYGKAEEQGGA